MLNSVMAGSTESHHSDPICGALKVPPFMSKKPASNSRRDLQSRQRLDQEQQLHEGSPSRYKLLRFSAVNWLLQLHYTICSFCIPGQCLGRPFLTANI